MEKILIGTILENIFAIQDKELSREDRYILEEASDKIQKLRDTYCPKGPRANYRCSSCGTIRELADCEVDTTPCPYCKKTGLWLPYIY